MTKERRITINTSEGEISAELNTLNYISLLSQFAGIYFQKEGHSSVSQRALKFSDDIFNFLEMIDYYDM